MKSYGVTIQLKPLRQYFCMVPFVFEYFYKKKFGILDDLSLALPPVKGLNYFALRVIITFRQLIVPNYISTKCLVLIPS